MNALFITACLLLSLPLIIQLLFRRYSASILFLLFAGICFSQKPNLNPFNLLIHTSPSTLDQQPLDSDGDGIPDEIEKSGYYPSVTEFEWHHPAETDLFLPWQRFTVKSDYKPFFFSEGFTFNGFNYVFVSPTGYLSFGKPLNDITLQNYPITNEWRRTIPQIAFAQGDNALHPQLGSKVYFSSPDETTRRVTLEKLFLNDSTNNFVSIQTNLHADGRLALRYKDLESNLAQTHRIGWQITGGGITLPTITNHTSIVLNPFPPTDPLSGDTDSDGLTDWEELFIYGSDPTNPTTAGDLLPDGWKALHGLNPATPYPIDTSTHVFGTDYPDATTNPDCGEGAIAVTLEALTNRPAWLTLTWSGGVNAQRRIPLAAPGGTHTLPLPRDGTTTLTATIQCADTTANGPWRNRLAFSADDPDWPTIPPEGHTGPRGLSTLPADSTDWLGGAQLLSTTASGTTLTPLSHTLHPIYGFCTSHQNHPITFPFSSTLGPHTQAASFEITLPYTLTTHPLTFNPTNYIDHTLITYTGQLTLTPPQTNHPPLTLQQSLYFHPPTNESETAPILVPAETQPDHTPGPFRVLSLPGPTTCPHCPNLGTPHLAIGFDHDKVFTRNIEIHPLENAEDKKIMHTLPLFWASGRRFHLDDLVSNFDQAPEGDLIFEGENVQGKQLVFKTEKPGELEPHIYRITLRYRPTGEIFDRLFIVVNRIETYTDFDAWYTQERNDLAWLNDLPPPPLRLADRQDSVTFNENTWYWSTPNNAVFDTFYHHTARTELRTSTGMFNSLLSGHQACYDEQGNLIHDGISAGTADRYSPENNIYYKSKHRTEDVLPYIQALQLEGNPVFPNSLSIPRRLTHPAVHMAVDGALNRYFECRPPHTARR